MLRTSVIARHEGVAAAETHGRVRSQDVAPSRIETSGSTLLRSNQSDKWQKVCVSLGVEPSKSVTIVWRWCVRVKTKHFGGCAIVHWHLKNPIWPLRHYNIITITTSPSVFVLER